MNMDLWAVFGAFCGFAAVAGLEFMRNETRIPLPRCARKMARRLGIRIPR